MKVRPTMLSVFVLLFLLLGESASPSKLVRLERERGKLYILAVGVNEYKAPLNPLKGAKADAIEFADALERAGKTNFDSVKKTVLVDGQATRAAMQAAFEKIAAEAKPGDTFVFHFAGSGWEVKEAAAPSFVLALFDTVIENLGTKKTSNEVGAALLGAWSSKIQAKNQVIILDSCHSGNSFEAFFPRVTGGSKELVELSGRSILVLGMEGLVQDSFKYEGKMINHSPLTFALIQGLETNGNITSKALEGFVAWKFPQLISSNDSDGGFTAAIKSYSVGKDFPLKNERKPEPKKAVASAGGTETKRAEETKAGASDSRGINDAIAKTLPAKQRDGTDYALLFATDTYDDSGFKPLSNPINDARVIAKDLEEIYGFQTTLITNPTLKDIWNKIREFQQRKYAKDDQLFIFFAGHGTFDEVGKTGYLIARDSQADNPMSHYAYPLLKEAIDNIPCDHVFLMLDVCFGGTFVEEVAKASSRSDREGEYRKISNPEFISRKMKYRSRKLLASGEKNPVSDGVPGRHSPFAKDFLEALRSLDGQEGVLTFNEVNKFVERGVSPALGVNFGSYQPGSDFLFITKSN